MTINDPIIGFLVYFAAMLINRVLAEKALKRLSAEEKARLLDSFSGYRIYSTVLLVIIVLVYFVGARARPDLGATFARGLFGLAVLSAVVITLLSYTKLKRLGVPRHYVNNFLVRSSLNFVGLMVLLFTLVTRYFSY